MRGTDQWQFTPYRPVNQAEEICRPFICRLAPGKDFIELQWFDRGSPGEHVLLWREKTTGQAWQEMTCKAGMTRIANLAADRA